MPLFGLLGYEFSAAMALLASFFAAWHGARARSAAEALLGAEAMLLLPLGIICLNALWVRNCDFKTGLAFYGLLPAISVLCGVAVGWACARLFRRPLLLACALIAGSLLWGFVRFYRTPAIFAFD